MKDPLRALKEELVSILDANALVLREFSDRAISVAPTLDEGAQVIARDLAQKALNQATRDRELLTAVNNLPLIREVKG